MESIPKLRCQCLSRCTRTHDSSLTSMTAGTTLSTTNCFGVSHICSAQNCIAFPVAESSAAPYSRARGEEEREGEGQQQPWRTVFVGNGSFLRALCRAVRLVNVGVRQTHGHVQVHWGTQATLRRKWSRQRCIASRSVDCIRIAPLQFARSARAPLGLPASPRSLQLRPADSHRAHSQYRPGWPRDDQRDQRLVQDHALQRCGMLRSQGTVLPSPVRPVSTWTDPPVLTSARSVHRSSEITGVGAHADRAVQVHGKTKHGARGSQARVPCIRFGRNPRLKLHSWRQTTYF